MTAIVLAAGLGSRMGPQPKLTLPFGTSTVVGETARALVRAGIFERIVVVTGHAAADVEAAISDALAPTSERLSGDPQTLPHRHPEPVEGSLPSNRLGSTPGCGAVVGRDPSTALAGARSAQDDGVQRGLQPVSEHTASGSDRSAQAQASPLGPGALGEHARPGWRSEVGTARRAVRGQRADGPVHDAPLHAASGQHTNVTVVHNVAFAGGMSGSIAAGAQDVPDGEPVAVMLGDLPLVCPETIRRLADALDGSGDVIRPSYRGVPGHPVVFGADHLPALRTLAPGDDGARDLARSARRIDVDDAGVVTDLDTRNAYDAARGTPSAAAANHPPDRFPTE